MSSPFERAHWRVLESHALPVRTHKRREPDYMRNGRPGIRTRKETLALNARVLELAAKGLSNVEIADRLHVSASVVGKHRRGLIKAVRTK